MSEDTKIAIDIWDASARPSRSQFPLEFAEKLTKREKHPLGDLFGLTVFGVNLTKIAPGGQSSVRHAHSVNDEFIYIVKGEATLVTDAGETPMNEGMCAGFKAGNGDAHHLVNQSDKDVYYFEIGDRLPNDEVVYPDDDLAVKKANGKRTFFHKDGTPY